MPEQFPHGIEAIKTGCHVSQLVTHGEKDRLDSSSAGRVVELGVTLGGVRDADEGSGGLHSSEGILEALQTAHFTKAKLLVPGKNIGGGETLEK